MGNPYIDLEGAAELATVMFGTIYGGAAFLKIYNQMSSENEEEVKKAVETEDPFQSYYSFGDAIPGSIYTTQ